MSTYTLYPSSLQQPDPSQTILPPIKHVIAASDGCILEVHNFWTNQLWYLHRLLCVLVHPREKKLYDAIKDAVLSTDPHGSPCRCYQRLRTVYASFSEYLEGDGALAQTTQVARPASEVLTEEFYCRLRRNTSMNNFVHDARRLPVDLPGSRSTDVRYTTPFNGPLADPTKGPLLKAELYQFQGPNRTLTGGVAWSHVNQSTVDHCTPELVGKYHGGRLVPSKGLPEGSRITDTIYCCVSDGPPLQT